MATVFMKYTPARAGLTGAEFLSSFMDENFSNVTWTGVISDGIIHYGFLTGTGDDISKAIMAIEGKFTTKRLDIVEFCGFVSALYNPIQMPGDPTPPTLIEFLDSYGITIFEADVLPALKAMKKVLFKEVVKKKFEDYNDLIADLARIVTLMTTYYDNLSPTDSTAVDAEIVSLQAIYTKDACMESLSRMVSNLQTYMGDYYTACMNVDAASDSTSVLEITYDG